MDVSDTVMIRVKRTTRSRLMAEIELLLEAEGAKQAPAVERPDNNNKSYRGMTVDAMIVRLLDQREEKKRRRNEAARRRRARE